MKVRMYNVGFGDCFCLRDRKKSLLVDFGKTMTKYMSENSIKSEREINKKNVTSGHYADVFLIYIIKHTRR